MSSTYAVRDNDPDARRHQLVWSGATLGTNGGGTKYYDGPISSPSNAMPAPQLVTAGQAKKLVVRVSVNSSGAGTITMTAKALTAAGATITLGSVVYNGGEVGVKSATLSGSLDLGAIVWMESVSSATVTSSTVTALALVEYWTDL